MDFSRAKSAPLAAQNNSARDLPAPVPDLYRAKGPSQGEHGRKRADRPQNVVAASVPAHATNQFPDR
jgi:hypothetical protein